MAEIRVTFPSSGKDFDIFSAETLKVLGLPSVQADSVVEKKIVHEYVLLGDITLNLKV